MKISFLNLAFLAFLAAPIFGAGAQPVLWRDPGNVGAWDFGGDVGTHVPPPKPPYTFVREDLSGTQPKIFVQDAAGVTWNVKLGYEAKGGSFCWRVVRACGYFAEPSYFISEGQVLGLRPLRRGGDWIHADGHFTTARFQYRYPYLRFSTDKNWRWDAPPFAGTKELSGLKILIMLFSNWDNKDERGGRVSANTAIFEQTNGKRMETIYAFTDWGSGMGRWGNIAGGETNWRCDDFERQTPDFVKGVDKGNVIFGYQGAIEQGFDTNIPPEHVSWLLSYLGHLTDEQLYSALRASGGSDRESACFTKALRDRIDQLRKVAGR